MAFSVRGGLLGLETCRGLVWLNISSLPPHFVALRALVSKAILAAASAKSFTAVGAFINFVAFLVVAAVGTFRIVGHRWG